MESKLNKIKLIKNKSIKNHLLKLLSYSLLVFSGLLSNFAIAQSTPACNADIVIHTWGENGRHGTIGDIFAQYSRTNSKVYYFKLIGLDSKKQYSVIPETATSGQNWQYLGVVQPDNRLHSWGESTDYGIGFGVIGNIYSVVNPTTKQTEYFALAALDFSADLSGKITALPTNSLSNQYWNYLGTTKPAQICDLGCNSQIKLHHWGENNNKGTIGDVYDLYNPFTQNVEYFKLKGVKADGTFGFRPMNKTDNQWWTYLGTGRLDNKVHVWSAGEKGGIGNIYSAINPTTNKVEYFALKALYKKQSGAAKLDTYGELPTNSADNNWWKYLGTTKPTSICDNDNGGTNADKIAPIITVLGKNPLNINVGDSYIDAGATAKDDIDGDLTSKIVTTGNVNTAVAGTYNIKYSVTDKAGNTALQIRIITVKSSTPPNPSLPPDPGEATLEGIDSNNNGVRDDIEIAIYNRHPSDSDSDKGKRDALMQEAKAMQKMLDVGESGDLNEAMKLFLDFNKSMRCIDEKNGGDANTQESYGFIETLLVNTDLRAETYNKYNFLLNGQELGGDTSSNPCDQ